MKQLITAYIQMMLIMFIIIYFLAHVSYWFEAIGKSVGRDF